VSRLVKLLYGALGMAKLHALTNRALISPLRTSRAPWACCSTCSAPCTCSPLKAVYMNDIRIRLEGGDIGDDFGKKLREHGIGGLSFHGPLTETQFRGLVAILAREPDPPRGLDCKRRCVRPHRQPRSRRIHHFRLAGEAGGHTAVDAATMSERGAACSTRSREPGRSRQPNPLPTRRL